SGCGDASQTLLRCDIDDDNSLYYKLTETPYDMDIGIESSEYHIAETQYGKPVLTGVRVEFDYIDDKTFDIDIYVDDELHSTHTNLEVGRDVTIPIAPVIGEQLSYEIKNCGATVRGVKWLVYNLPLRIYSLLETELIEDIIVIGQYVFVSYNETTVVYATANGQAEIMATVVGKLMKFPAQEEGDVYFAVSKDGMIYAYHLSREGIIPVYELEGIKAVVSTEQGIGIVLSVFNGTSVSTYKLVSGNVIYLGIIESTLLSTVTNVGTYRKGDTVSVAIQTTDPLKYQTTNNIPNLDHVLKPYELESSEFIFPYINGRYLLFGVKINFDKAPLVNDPHNSFDINVYANDELHYVSTNHDVDAEVVIRFSAVPVGYAKFRIANCYQHIRSIKWLAYKLPFINETIVNTGNEEIVVDPDLLLYEDVVVGDYETQKYRLTIIGKATEPVEIDPQNENFSLSLSEHGVYSPTLTVQPKDGVIDKDIYVKWSPLDSGLIATHIKNTYKSLLAYVTCVASAIEVIEEGELKIFNALAAPGENITINVVWSTNKPSRSKTWWMCEETGITEWVEDTESFDYTKYHTATISGLPIDALINIRIVCEIDNPYEFAEEIIEIKQRTTNHIEPNDVDGLSSNYSGVEIYTPAYIKTKRPTLTLTTSIDFGSSMDVDGLSAVYVSAEIIEPDTAATMFDSAISTDVLTELEPE
ncbi:MAG: hypothetical protein WCY96_07765, partial [Candidatus Cloacimonadaceae bacterium]